MKKYVIISSAMLAFLGCSRQEQPKSGVPEPKTRVIVAAVAFTKGEVSAFTGSAWEPMAIGLGLEGADSLDLASNSQAELKGAEGRVVRLAGPAKGAVADLMAAAAASERSAAGKVLDKVKKLEGAKQTYTTQTPTAVAGIRGAPGRKAVPDTSKKDSLPQ